MQSPPMTKPWHGSLIWPALGSAAVMLLRRKSGTGGDAFAAYDKALMFKSDLAEAWLGRGSISSDLKQYEDAATAFDRALALKPDLAEAWLGRGKIWTELKQYDRASAAFDAALARKPDLAKAWLGRGRVFTERGQHGEALAAYDRALALGPRLGLRRGRAAGCKTLFMRLDQSES